MTEMLIQIINIIEEVNNNSTQPIIASQKINKEKEYLQDFDNITAKLTNVVTMLKNTDKKNYQKIQSNLLELRSHMIDFHEQIEAIYELVSELALNYKVPSK